jgi:hypothetical protein
MIEILFYVKTNLHAEYRKHLLVSSSPIDHARDVVVLCSPILNLLLIPVNMCRYREADYGENVYTFAQAASCCGNCYGKSARKHATPMLGYVLLVFGAGNVAWTFGHNPHSSISSSIFAYVKDPPTQTKPKTSHRQKLLLVTTIDGERLRR